MATAENLEDDTVTQDALLRAALRGEQQGLGEAAAFSGEQIRSALERANDAVHAEHRAATSIWRSPLSLFDSRAETAARQQGVPPWAIDAVLKAQQLGFEAAQLDDRNDAYKTQIEMAKREHRGIARAPLLQQLEQLDWLAHRLREHLPQLQAARDLFDAPEEATEAAPPGLPSEAAFAADRAVAEAERRGGAPSLGEAGVRAEAELKEPEAPGFILEQRPTEHRRSWRDVFRRSQEEMPRLLESALDVGMGRIFSALESVGVSQAGTEPNTSTEDVAGGFAPLWSQDVARGDSTIRIY